MSKSILVDNLTGVILAGGKSSRMRVDKSLLKIDDVTLIERCYELMKSVFTKVVISTNNPDQFDFINSEKVKDIYQDFGPLSGIYSALKFLNAKKVFVLSVDMPFILPDLIRYLINFETDELITVPFAEQRTHYLSGIYSIELIPILESILESNIEARNNNKEIIKSSLSLWNFVERVGAEIVNVEEKVFYMKDLFFNINTPADFEYVKNRLI
ncbi:MAG: molybdenum cofactor guanylyltransferase [Melioribacter sp.]|nr:molybdenum cofactor guanylyltransferase [Melioribacter sp.]